MKPINRYEINEWSFNDCVDWLATYGVENIDVVAIIAKRLRELHEKHRWIPVEERMPDDDDVVRVYTGLFDTYGESYGRWCEDANRWFVDGTNCSGDVTHWKRIDKPEGV